MAYFKSSFPPPPAPAAPLNTIRRISFRHPAYPEPAPDLLCLPAADGDGQDGIDYDTAFVACCIVTGNTWNDGWLARKNSQGEFQRVDKPSDGILRGDTYYFRLGQNPVEHKYPVLPSFDHWRFPHGDVPAPWSSLRIPSAGLSVNLKQKTAALSRDGTCRISGYLDAVEVAHIVPRASGYWFEYNSMARYTRLSDVPQQVDDDQNLITLRRDLRYLFDQRRFTFVVKQPREDDSLQVVTHVLCAQGSTELISLYHNRLPQPLSGISTELLFARFAWSLFDNKTFPFFQGLQSYKVLVYDLSTFQYSTKDLKAGKIRDVSVLFQAYPQSRNPSPRKRTNDEISKCNVDAEMGWSTDDDVSSGDEDYPPRGRHRRRCVEWDSGSEEPSGLAGSTSSASPPTSQDLLKLATEGPSNMVSDLHDGRKTAFDSRNLVLHLERGPDGRDGLSGGGV